MQLSPSAKESAVPSESPCKAPDLELRPYQIEGNEAVRQALRRGCRHVLISIPTGGGKTLMQAELCHGLFFNESAIRQNVQGLIIVYSKILVQQTQSALRQFYGIAAEIEQGEHKADPNARIVVASAMSLVDRIHKYDPHRPRLIILDECHHAVTTTTQEILRSLNALKGAESAKDFKGFLTGWTATPARADGKGLDSIFDEIVYHVRIEELINQGYLARPLGYRIHSDIDLEGVNLVQNEYGTDFDPIQLAKTIDTNAANKLIVDSYLKLCNGLPTMVFSVNRTHAKHIAECFVKQGIKAVMLDHRSGKRERDAALKGLTTKEVQVIVTVNLLSEGFDCPALTCVILARPTSSEPLYRQMIGRPMRPHPDSGKKHCIIVDIVHNSARLEISSLPSLFGIPHQFFDRNDKPVDVVQLAEQVEGFKKQNPQIDISKLANIQDLRKMSHIEAVDLVLAEPATELIEISKLPWLKNDPRTYSLALSNKEYLMLEKNLLSQFQVSFTRLGTGNEILGNALPLEEALRVSREFIEAHFPEKLGFLSTDADWRRKSVSDKQLQFLTRRKLDFEPKTRDEASYQITAIIELEQKKLLSDCEALLEDIEQLQSENLPTPLCAIIEMLRKQYDSGDIQKTLFWKAKRLSNAVKAETLVQKIHKQKKSPFFQHIHRNIEEIKESAGEKGFLHDNVLKKLEDIVKEQAGAA